MKVVALSLVALGIFACAATSQTQPVFKFPEFKPTWKARSNNDPIEDPRVTSVKFKQLENGRWSVGYLTDYGEFFQLRDVTVGMHELPPNVGISSIFELTVREKKLFDFEPAVDYLVVGGSIFPGYYLWGSRMFLKWKDVEVKTTDLIGELSQVGSRILNSKQFNPRDIVEITPPPRALARLRELQRAN